MASADDILSLYSQCFEFSSSVYEDYAKRTDDVLSGKQTNISNIELLMDYLVDFCFDPRFVFLYKRICKYLLPKYPKLVCEHIAIIKQLSGDEIMETETIEFELDAELYEKAKAILATFGMTVEEACVLFIKAVVARKELPFPLSEQELELIRNKRLGDGE